jgi:hypothetical protein
MLGLDRRYLSVDLAEASILQPGRVVVDTTPQRA